MSKLQHSKQRAAEIDSCFTQKLNFTVLRMRKISKNFWRPRKYLQRDTERKIEIEIDRERVEKWIFGNASNKVSNGMSEYVERNSLVILEDVSRLADTSKSFVMFMTTCRKFGYSLTYVFQETAVSSPRWKIYFLRRRYSLSFHLQLI